MGVNNAYKKICYLENRQKVVGLEAVIVAVGAWMADEKVCGS